MNYRLSSTPHLLTIDVTDWHRDPALAAATRKGPLDGLEERVSRNTNTLLEELAKTASSATFFVTPSIARRDVALMRQILSSGHELAAYGEYGGDDFDGFRADARHAKRTIEDLAGSQIRGFRAPRSRIDPVGTWRFDALAEVGYEFDSSRVAGREGAPGYAQTIVCGGGWLIEVPLNASVRHAPYWRMRAELEGRTRAGMSGVVSFATWEIDHEQPKLPLPVIASIRHYHGRRATRERVNQLLRDFRFDAIEHRLAELAQDAPATFAA